MSEKGATMTTKVCATTWKPTSTRKRRLPVHELALFRTTTLDGGLPQPSDIAVAFAIPFAVNDPVEEVQMQNCNIAMGTSRRLHDTFVPRRMLSPRRFQQPNSNSLLRYRLMDNPARSCQGLPATFDSYPGLRNLCDGFVGPELQLTSEIRPVRQGINNSTRKSTSTVVRELALIQQQSRKMTACRILGTNTLHLCPRVTRLRYALAVPQNSIHVAITDLRFPEPRVALLLSGATLAAPIGKEPEKNDSRNPKNHMICKMQTTRAKYFQFKLQYVSSVPRYEP
ncbi:hypothetical protein GMOD_00007648 [Pyrenophora seminiperda CCB06]|uniref:Uncharacterized protein n=1 Tax=Pyrenophora seminiperda CCB06 TaxID=1302712 RepID=A0A3M7MDN9_9PLEO|nr:hypothetical protein GMOD_00007648 [Pyrenophora seminiperda CCB06]